MLFTILLVVQTIVAASLVGVILMQRSEGGGLGVGGSSSGLMTARGAADFLTRATSILGGLFIVLSIALATVATVDRAPQAIDTRLARDPATAPATAPATTPVPGAGPTTPATPVTTPSRDPLTGAGGPSPLGNTPANTTDPLAPRGAR